MILLSFLDISIFWQWRWELSFLAVVIPWIVIIALQVLSWILFIKSVKNLIMCRHYRKAYLRCIASFMSNGRTITNVGAPGVGKTFAGVNVAYSLALQRWSDLQRDYILAESMVDEWRRTLNTDKLIDYEAKKAAYEYYAARQNEYIPCLISSIPIRERKTGRMSYQFEPEMFLQTMRIPEYSVLFNDESGMLWGCKTSTGINNSVADYWRLYRQIADIMNVNTEQGDDGNGKYMRKSTDYNSRLYGQEWKLQPRFLLWLFAKREKHYYKKVGKGRWKGQRVIYEGQKLYYNYRYIKTIGYRKIIRRLEAVGVPGVGDKEIMIFPAIGNAEYDDRSFRNDYKAKDLPIELKGFDTLVIDDRDIRSYDSFITGNSGNKAV